MTQAVVIDINLENAQRVIIEGSQDKLVIIDFWADWCESCKQLMPTLEKLAAAFPTQVVLAKVNCDEQQQLATQFNIRSLPTVIFFKDGQPVDGFAGVERESTIRARIEKYLPTVDDELVTQALKCVETGEYEQGYTLAKQAVDINPDSSQAQIVLADAACELGRLEQAEQLLSSIRMVDQDQYFQHVMSKLNVAKQAADSPELRQLAEQLTSAPDNHELRLELAAKLYAAHRAEEALEHIFAVLRQDLNFGQAKQQALDMLNALPKGDPLAASYRRKLYSMLY
ncbi:thioredoxin [Pseudidiomarina gelatinasegens]|uniref:Thioredoxin n=1 Tax=Pseudidiomarina gelatinasegens TaxID=2487740 RepID=A0A451GF83_9GAMM|nr:thioredoxin [Pseudidiomarina gelatinasegens]RWU11799.1 thioredoxin [Pseudidiomarina gelatinasegens]